MPMIENFFTVNNITDPDGDALVVKGVRAGGSTQSTLDVDGYLTKAMDGPGGAVMRIKPNGDFTMDAGTLLAQYGTATVSVQVHYGDNKAADHSTDNAVDRIVTWEIPVTGLLGENQPPTAPVDNIATTPYVEAP